MEYFIMILRHFTLNFKRLKYFTLKIEIRMTRNKPQPTPLGISTNIKFSKLPTTPMQ